MQQYILRRILLNLVVIYFVATLVFLLLRVNTDYVVTQRALQTQVEDPEAAKALGREDLGLNDSIVVQYKNYMWNLAQGDLGESFQAKDDVMDEIGRRIGPSLELGILQIFI